MCGGGTRLASAWLVELRFEWDPEKATANLAKHGVSFDEARLIFDDPLAQTVPDAAHALDENRLRTIGLASDGRILIVFHTDRGDTIRIIGARRATKREQHDHEENSF